MIGVGSLVRIKTTNLEGVVLTIKENFAEVNVNNQNSWHPVDQLEEQTENLVSRILKNDLDDVLDFILSIDAYRLLTEYKFNPYVLASSTKIQIFPHQIDEVIWGLENPKIMIADEVGLGKTIIAALIISELKARGLAKKSLFVVPKSLVIKWRNELQDRFDINVQILDSQFTKLTPNPFDKDEFAYVTSMDYLKQQNIRENMQTNFDTVVVDEAHKFKLGTDRLDLGRILSEKSNVLIFLTATPHDGRDDDFMARINLLDPFVSDIGSSSYLWTRNIKEDVRDIEGKEVFPDRTSKTIDIELTNRERIINELLDDYFTDRYEEAKSPKDVNAVRFLHHIFKKRASSSIVALKISLSRRLAKLGAITNSDQILKDQSDITQIDDDLDEEYDDATRKVEGFTLATDMVAEKASLANMIKEIENLGTKDTKLEILEKSINELKTEDPLAKLVLFTEYRDTLDYLKEKLSQKYKVDKIDGTMSIVERNDALNRFRKDDGPEVLLCTDAAGEGIDMQFCNIEINYDLPWNPNKLEQRMGRIHRIGQTRKVKYYNFVVDKEKSIDGYILSKLLIKIESIKASMGAKIYDIIGILVGSNDIAMYYDELRKVPKEKWEAKVTELLEQIEEKKNRILEKSKLLLEGHRLDSRQIEKMTNIRKTAVTIDEIKRFLETLAESKDGKFEKLSDKEKYYKIFPPQEYARSLNLGVIEGTFDPKLAEQKGWAYLALGNREINEIIAKTAKKSVASLTHPTKTGLLCVYKISIIDGRGRERNSRIVALFHDEDGKVTPDVDPRSVWDYEQGIEIKNTAFIVSSKNRVEEEVQKIVQQFKDETQKKMSEIETKTIDATKKYLSDKIEQANNSISELEQKRNEGPHIEKLIKQRQNKILADRKQVNQRIDEIKQEFQARSRIELIAIASIKSEMDSSIRHEIDKAGMKAVIEYEMKRATTDEQRKLIVDVSDRDTGADINSFDRVIEVKSHKTTGPVRITSHEWLTAQRRQDEYWLYVVENALDNPKITTIQNPYEKFKNSVKEEEVTELRYVIENWKS